MKAVPFWVEVFWVLLPVVGFILLVVVALYGNEDEDNDKRGHGPRAPWLDR